MPQKFLPGGLSGLSRTYSIKFMAGTFFKCFSWMLFADFYWAATVVKTSGCLDIPHVCLVFSFYSKSMPKRRANLCIAPEWKISTLKKAMVQLCCSVTQAAEKTCPLPWFPNRFVSSLRRLVISDISLAARRVDFWTNGHVSSETLSHKSWQ